MFVRDDDDDDDTVTTAWNAFSCLRFMLGEISKRSQLRPAFLNALERHLRHKL